MLIVAMMYVLFTLAIASGGSLWDGISVSTSNIIFWVWTSFWACLIPFAVKDLHREVVEERKERLLAGWSDWRYSRRGKTTR